jgi:hypothetical protein
MLKALSIVLVLIWHLQPIESKFSGLNQEQLLFGEVMGFFYKYISLLAVPTFITVSMYLLMQRIPLTWTHIKNRLLHLSHIFLFWVLVQYMFYMLTTGSIILPSFDDVKAGGPGGSVFYFLFVLIRATALSFLFMTLNETAKMILSGLVIVISCMYFMLSPLYDISVATTSMKNYYVYIPLAYLFLKYKEKFIRYRMIFFCCFILAIVFEELFIQHCFSAYARLSIFCGVIYFISAIHAREFKHVMALEWLSRFSLGIFALHLYCQYFFLFLFGALKSHIPDVVMLPSVEKMLIFVLTVTITFSSVYLLSKTKLKVYVG